MTERINDENHPDLVQKFNELSVHYGLIDEAETIEKGATYLAKKMERAVKMHDNWLIFDRLSRDYWGIELYLKTKTLTRKEAAEKA